MESNEVFSFFRQVVNRAGMEDIISVGENVNELADIMIYQEENNSAQALILFGNYLFPLECIKSILYKYGDSNLYHYAESELQFLIILEEGYKYVVEFSKNGSTEDIFYEGVWRTGKDEVKKVLEQYNKKWLQGINIIKMVFAAEQYIKKGFGGNMVAYSERIKEVINYYMKENPTNRFFLFNCAFLSLLLFENENEDVFDIKHIFRQIIAIHGEEEFVQFLVTASENPNDCLMLVCLTWAIIRKIKKEDPDLAADGEFADNSIYYEFPYLDSGHVLSWCELP